MKKPKIQIKSRWNIAEDEKKAKVMEQLINHEFEENREFIEKIQRARKTIDTLYGINSPTDLWDGIMEAGLRLKMNTLLKQKDTEKGKEEGDGR